MDELEQICKLAGTKSFKNSLQGSNISITGSEKSKIQSENNIKPGTPEWFKLWFSLPYLTGEKPI